MSNKTKRRWLKPFLSGTALLAACGVATAASGPVSTHVRSSGGTCSTGYQHIYITVKDVTAHTSSGGWQDLTPGLASAPVQVDLLDEAPTDCFLATLGVTSGLPPGKYQQIRFILADGGKSVGKGKKKGGGGGTGPSTNACSSLSPTTYNCIDLGGGNLVPIKLTSEGKTGIKIPPGQIAGGGLVISDGQGLDLDIDFNACKSIVQAGKSGNYILKPTLHADEIDLSALIAGSVVAGTDSAGSVTPGATAVPGASLWLESQTPALNLNIGTPASTANTAQVDNVVAKATADTNGHFEFCPVPAGTYELVADSGSMPVTGTSSNATITTGLAVTKSGGPNNLVIPLLDDGTSPALLEGVFSTEAAASAGLGDDIAFAGVQPFNGTSGTVQAVIPPLGSSVPAPVGGNLPSVTTVASPTGGNCPDIPVPTCPTGTNCECFTLAVPASNPVIGAWTAGGTTYNSPAAGTIDYSITGAASQIGNPSTPECAPSALITDPALAFSVLGASVTEADNPTSGILPTLSFQSCD